MHDPIEPTPEQEYAGRMDAADRAVLAEEQAAIRAEERAATPKGFPRLHPDALCLLATPFGEETWTGAEWNEHAEAAERNGNFIVERFLLIQDGPALTPEDVARDRGTEL